VYVTPSRVSEWIGLSPEPDSDKQAIRTAVLTQIINTVETRIHRVCGRTFHDRNPATGEDAVDPTSKIVRVASFVSEMLLDDDLYELTSVSVGGSDIPLDQIEKISYSPDRTFPYRALSLSNGDGDLRYWSPTAGAVAVTVTGRWGWREVPAGVAQTMLMLSARLWQRRTTTLGVVMGSDVAYGAAEMSALHMPRWDSDIYDLLQDYCTGRVY